MALYSINFSPRILYESFGYKNIEVDSIAFAEQIKNSYDAKAKNITLDFSEYDNDKISIIDDGTGMNEKELIENWLLVGTTSKANIKDALGGKGIGRFSLFRIANTITVISKKKNELEYELSLKKDILENLHFTEHSEVEINQNKIPKIFKNKSDSGTSIILTGLKQIDFFEIFYELYNLIEPRKISDFSTKINYIYPKSFSEPYVMLMENALKYAPFICKASFRSNNIIEYDFICNVKNTILYRNNDVKKLSHKFSKLEQVDLGKIEFYLHNFYFDPTFVSLLSIPQVEIQNSFLNIYQGISVYRQGFKIYGHGKTDWLNLAEMRVANPTRCIDNKLTFGYASLKRPDSDLLEEKTNRESFIKGKEYNYFRNAITFLIEKFNKDRTKSINIIRNRESKNDFKLIREMIQNCQENKKESNKNNDSNEIKIHNMSHKSNQPLILKTDANETSSTETNGALKNERTDNTINEKSTNTPIQKPKPKFSDKVIIDASFECYDSTPEKIKRIIYELQTLKETSTQTVLYSQALLLRCLIDISTQYAQKKLGVARNNNNDLLDNISKLLNFIWQKNLLLDKAKHISELRTFIKEEKIIKYFNGIAHDYDYRAHFDDLKKIWDKFEFYIEFCVKQ